MSKRSSCGEVKLRSELPKDRGEQEEMVELEVVMLRQSEGMVVIEVKRETLSQDKEQWGQQDVVAVTDESSLCLGISVTSWGKSRR